MNDTEQILQALQTIIVTAVGAGAALLAYKLGHRAAIKFIMGDDERIGAYDPSLK